MNQPTTPSLAWRLPGDPPPAEQVQRMIRVDHAGEYGARRIYAGQLSVLGRGPAGPAIRHMAEQEARHLAAFEQLMVARRVRPTALLPVWHLAGYAMGAATALLGEKAAMACTVAVEEVIDQHYRDQSVALGEADGVLKEKIEAFRAEELEHRETALQAGATEAPAYPLLSAAIKAASRLAIRISERF